MPSDTLDWKEKLSFVSPQGEDHEVAPGVVLTFYPVSVAAAFKLRKAGKLLVKALSYFFADNGRDSDTIIRKIKSPDTESSEENYLAPKVELAKLRQEQKDKAIEDLIDAITEPENMAMVGLLIMDSLRDVFPRDKKREWPPGSEFIESMEVTQIVPYIVGLAKANKKVLGPLADRLDLSGLASKMQASVEAKLNSDGSLPSDGEPTTAGENSRTKSVG